MSILSLLSSDIFSKISPFIFIFILVCSIITGVIAKNKTDKNKEPVTNTFINFTLFINIVMLLYKIGRIVISTYSGGML